LIILIYIWRRVQFMKGLCWQHLKIFMLDKDVRKAM
jgi:hypothetical protein